MEWMIMPLRRFTDFSGRSRRKEFWMFYLFVMIGLFVAIMLDSALGLGGTTETYSDASGTGVSAGFNSTGGVLTVIFALAMLLPFIACAARRMHDLGKSGWTLLFGFIPFFGALYLLYLYVQPGEKGPNRFGPDPIKEAPVLV